MLLRRLTYGAKVNFYKKTFFENLLTKKLFKKIITMRREKFD